MSVKSGTSAFSLGSGSSSRRSSKVYEPELVSSVDEALLAELATTPAPWTHKSLYGPKPNGVPANPPPERSPIPARACERTFPGISQVNAQASRAPLRLIRSFILVCAIVHNRPCIARVLALNPREAQRSPTKKNKPPNEQPP